MRNKRQIMQRDKLLEQLDELLEESSCLFIQQRPALREKMGWKEEKNVDVKKEENDRAIQSVTSALLEVLNKDVELVDKSVVKLELGI